MPSPQSRTFPALAVLGIAAFLAILPLLLRGPSCGHDFDFHLLSWLEAANQFAHFGYPHWAYTPAWNAGEPRFLFYPPLSWTLGAILGLILPWNAVPIAFTWVALYASGLTMHRLARQYASPAAATIAATVYLANPYMLFTAYERTAYGELLAAAWLPLLFAAAFVQRVRILPIAGAIALLWLTNAPAAVMGSYALAFLTMIRLARQGWQTGREFDEWQQDWTQQERPVSSDALPFYNGLPMVNSQLGRPDVPVTNRMSILMSMLPLASVTAFATALGLALAAFYIVPAAYEQRFVQVQMAVIPGMRVQDHFLFHRMAGHTFDDIFHDIVVRTASEIALTILAGITIALLCPIFAAALSRLRWASSEARPHPPISGSALPPNNNPVLPLALLTTLIAFLLTPPSLILWTHIPKLAFLQFPWRLTAILGVILALATALALKHLRPSISASLIPLLLSMLLILPAYHLFAQRCDREDTVPFRVALFHSNIGTEPTDEYTPIGADNDLLSQQTDPPYWLYPQSERLGKTSVFMERPLYLSEVVPNTLSTNAPPPAHTIPGQAPTHIMLDLPEPEYLVLNRREYPHWQIVLNGKKPAALPWRQWLRIDPIPTTYEFPPYPLHRKDGLIVVALPQGHSTIDLVWVRTFDQTIGLLFTVIAALIALLIARRKLTTSSSQA